MRRQIKRLVKFNSPDDIERIKIIGFDDSNNPATTFIIFFVFNTGWAKSNSSPFYNIGRLVSVLLKPTEVLEKHM